jgi:uncharacterized membrane protein required for colicin V production
VRQSAVLASALAAVGVGYPLSKDLARLVDLPAPMNRLVSFVVLSLLISLTLCLIASGIRKALVRRDLKAWDGAAGALLGALKGFALATVLTLAVLAKKEEWRPAFRESAVAKVMSRSLEVLHPLWPPEVRPAVHPYVHFLDPAGQVPIRN